VDNLDLMAAQAAQRITDATARHKSAEVDNLATKVLGVLQENGVYAAVLYLLSREREKPIARAIDHELWGLLQSLQPGVGARPTKEEEELKAVAAVAAQPEDLLLVKRLWEQALIYARYQAKAREG